MNVHFVVTLGEKDMEKAEAQGFIEFFKLTTKIHTSNMFCFDFDGKIRKYESAEEIIEDFYPQRLAFYQKRKDHMANTLQLELDRLTNQARFIQMIVTKELVVSGRKKVDIVAELRRRDFRPFPKIAKAKAAGETEEVLEGDEEEEDVTDSNDYDYLLNMAISSLTKERVRTVMSDQCSVVKRRRVFRSTSSGSRPTTRKPNSSGFSSSLLSRCGTPTSTASSKNGRCVFQSSSLPHASYPLPRSLTSIGSTKPSNLVRSPRRASASNRPSPRWPAKRRRRPARTKMTTSSRRRQARLKPRKHLTPSPRRNQQRSSMSRTKTPTMDTSSPRRRRPVLLPRRRPLRK